MSCPNCGSDAFHNDRIKYRGKWVNQCVNCDEYSLYDDATDKLTKFAAKKHIAKISAARSKRKNDPKDADSYEIR